MITVTLSRSEVVLIFVAWMVTIFVSAFVRTLLERHGKRDGS